MTRAAGSQLLRETPDYRGFNELQGIKKARPRK